MQTVGLAVVVFVGFYLAIWGVVYVRDTAISGGGTSAFDTPLEPVIFYRPFEHTGTLTYFREGTGRMNAYLMYQVASSTQSKILNITSETTCDIAELRGCPDSVAALRAAVGEGPVSVAGSFRNEELYADTLTY